MVLEAMMDPDMRRHYHGVRRGGEHEPIRRASADRRRRRTDPGLLQKFLMRNGFW
jgi:hypothetical protein